MRSFACALWTYYLLWFEDSTFIDYDDYEDEYEEDYYDDSGSGEYYEEDYDDYSGSYPNEDYDEYDSEDEISGDFYEYETKYFYIPYCHKHKGGLWTLYKDIIHDSLWK